MWVWRGQRACQRGRGGSQSGMSGAPLTNEAIWKGIAPGNPCLLAWSTISAHCSGFRGSGGWLGSTAAWGWGGLASWSGAGVESLMVMCWGLWEGIELYLWPPRRNTLSVGATSTQGNVFQGNGGSL